MSAAHQLPFRPEYQDVAKTLGIRASKAAQSGNATIQYMQLVKSRLSYAALHTFIKHSALSQKQVAAIIDLSERTVQRNDVNQKLSLAASERLVDLARLFHHGAAVFGNNARFLQWLEHPNLALGGQQPMSYLDTGFGQQLIQDELGRIEHGIPS